MIRAFGFNEFLYILQAVQWTVLLSLTAFAGGALVGLPRGPAALGAAEPGCEPSPQPTSSC